MVFRILPELTDPNLTIEDLGTKNITLGNSIADFGYYYPKSASASVIGIELIFNITITNGSTAAITGNLMASLFNQMTVIQGTKTKLQVNSFAQLQRVYNMITGLQLPADISLDQGTSTTQTYTYSTGIMPFMWQISPDLPYVDVKLNPLSSLSGGPASSGSASLDVRYYYYPHSQNDQFAIFQPASSVAANTDINVSTIVNIPGAVDTLYIDVSSDNNLNYAKFAIGKTDLTDKMTVSELSQIVFPYSIFSRISGFVPLPVKKGTVFTVGVNPNAPILTLNFSSSIQPTFYELEM